MVPLMKTWSSAVCGVAALGLALPLVGGQPARAAGPEAYDRLFPHYAEFCAATQITKKSGFGAEVRGGKGGHGVIYIRGACRDKSSPNPRIKVCDPAEVAAGMEPGVGVSVNSDFENSNWVATESKSFFLTGDLAPGERLTREGYLRARAKAVEMGILKGIRFHEKILAKTPASMTPDEFMLEETIGTDFAIAFGRSLYCARIPLKAEMLPAIVGFLNEQNDQYFYTDRKYKWSGIRDNCTHTTHNALAAADVWSDVKINRPWVRQVFNIAAPSNNFVELALRANDLPLEDPISLFNDPEARRTLLESDWLPTQPGGVAEVFPVIPANDVYETDGTFLFLEAPILPINKLAFKRILKTPRYLDLETNLRWFERRYEKLLANRDSLQTYRDRHHMAEDARVNALVDSPEFAEFYEALYRHLARQLDDVREKLARLQALP